jgi:hypothetical protein
VKQQVEGIADAQLGQLFADGLADFKLYGQNANPKTANA